VASQDSTSWKLVLDELQEDRSVPGNLRLLTGAWGADRGLLTREARRG